jgi:hypothetical protein
MPMLRIRQAFVWSGSGWRHAQSKWLDRGYHVSNGLLLPIVDEGVALFQ